ncbi:hypothetical protein [Portibacter lacus]|uniref:DUF4890 domain-containing protein n=1 Tax=Portibacter lacus TaxID=1099794 RepID=A0AA37SYN0_9BACT|nr:hypothetical protein [Portibacter lacus]GLR20133.1 hypothetical protein GCM10007940_47490 [Portibacter lacus]
MKKLKMTGMIMFALMIATFSFAQKGHKKDLNKLNSELNLTDDQSLELQKARTAAQAKMKVIRADENLSKDEKRTEIRKMRTEQKEVMDKVLTDEQKLKMKELRKEGRKNGEMKRERGKEDRAELKKMRAEFDSKISAEDKAEITRIKEALKGDREKGKMEAEDREAFREAHKADFEKLKEISEKYKPEIQALMKDKSEMRNKEKSGEKKMKSEDQKREHKGKRDGKGKRGNKTTGFLLMDF